MGEEPWFVGYHSIARRYTKLSVCAQPSFTQPSFAQSSFSQPSFTPPSFTPYSHMELGLATRQFHHIPLFSQPGLAHLALITLDLNGEIFHAAAYPTTTLKLFRHVFQFVGG